MTTATAVSHQVETQESWVPMIAIALGQMIMSFNVASLPVAMGGMVQSFNVPPTTVATGIVAYSMLVAGFVMLGAKLTQRYGAINVFRAAVIVFGGAQVLMTFSPRIAPSYFASPTTGLVDGTTVKVEFDDEDRAGTPVKIQQRVCDRTNPLASVCATTPGVRGTLDENGRLTLSLTVRRTVGGMDCARAYDPFYDCQVEALVSQTVSGPPDPSYGGRRVPISFATVG